MALSERNSHYKTELGKTNNQVLNIQRELGLLNIIAEKNNILGQRNGQL